MEQNSAPLELRQCEQDLKLAEERLQTISMQTDSWLWETDENHICSYFSDNLEIQTGLRKVDLIGTSRLEAALQNNDLNWQKHGQDIAKLRPFKDFRYIQKTLDGEDRHIIATGWPLFADDGTFSGYRGTAWDETQDVLFGRRQIEKEESLLAEIESQRANLETVLENLTQSVMWFDKYGVIRLNNAQTSKMLGFSDQEYSNVHSIRDHLKLMAERGDFGDVDVKVEVENRFQRLCGEQEGASSYRIHLKASDRYLDVGLSPLADGSRILTHTDVTAEAKKDRELSDREAMLSTVIDNVDYGILFMDENLNCDVVNARFGEMWGMGDELINSKPTFVELMEFNRHTGLYDVNGHDDDDWNDYVKVRLNVIQSADTGTIEIARADGRYFKFSTVSLAGGKRMATYFDITEIKEMELALREANEDLEYRLQQLNQREAVLESLINNIDYGTLVLDRDQKVELANKKFRQLMSIDAPFLQNAPSMRDVLDRMFENKCTGLVSGNRSEWPDYRASVLEQIQQGHFLTAERQRQDGKTILSSCMTLPGGRRLVTYFDMTEHKDREEKLEAMQNDLAQANQLLEKRVEQRTQELRTMQSTLVKKERQALLGDLVASLCHELRNPLNALNTSLFLIRRKVEGDFPALTKAFDRSDRTIVRCTNILNDLYDYALVDDLHKELTKMGPWIEQVVAQVKIPQAFEVELDIDPDLPDCELDPKQLGGAIGKIITNAAQAIADHHDPKADPKIAVYVGDCGDLIEIIVTDNGPGMSEDIFARALEPLYSTRGFGVGLGLPIAEQIVSRHGGQIRLLTQEGAGTTVTIWLPTSKHQLEAA